ncbi:MAG: hypothetical protein JWR05_1146 [Mucilaginibacter sp.]|nr:hypothetical protein [Mucilaginibacter sp.]
MNKKKTVKVIKITFLVMICAAIVYVVGYGIMLINAIGLFDKNYTTAELIESFINKRSEIYGVKNYFQSIVPKYKLVDIEFEKDNIAHLVISPIDTGRGSDLTINFQDWNIPIKSKKTDSLLKVLGWTKSTLDKIKSKLNDANCISITNEEPTKIGFKRSGMGMYFFNVFDKTIPDSLKSRYNDSCTYIYVNKNLVLEYGGGAVGGQCFAKQK